MNKLVSIIIPVFNAEKSIGFTLKSVLTQTYKHVEIIVVNDGSTDSSEELILSLQDSRIKYIKQNNSGSPIAKNTGLKIAQGEYVQFLDADDALSIDKIENQVKLLQNKKNAITVCRTQIFYTNEDVKKTDLLEIDTSFLTFSNNPYLFLLNLMGINGKIGMVQPNAYLTPKSLINISGSWSEELNKSPDDDSEFFCRVLLNASEIIYDEKSINFYRKSTNYLSSGRTLLNALGALKTIELKADNILKRNDSIEVKKMLALHYAIIVYIHGSKFCQLIALAKSKLLELKIKKFPIVGGIHFRILANVVGFENAIKIRSNFR